MVRTEYHCAKCGVHHGHVFNDGPGKNGKRFCNNGLCLIFKPANLLFQIIKFSCRNSCHFIRFIFIDKPNANPPLNASPAPVVSIACTDVAFKINFLFPIRVK